MPTRESRGFDESITTERAILKDYLRQEKDLPTEIATVGVPCRPNPVSSLVLGAYRPRDSKKVVTADLEVLSAFAASGRNLPAFLDAGPRAELYFDPNSVRAAIVTTDGLAPGLNSVVHSIVKRHIQTYKLRPDNGGAVFGVRDSFIGLRRRPMELVGLQPDETEDWLEKGGSELGNRRSKKDDNIEKVAADLASNLKENQINILYVIGGDGSQALAHEIALKASHVAVVGVPKTMDNDLVWVWQSFGFDTAVENATEVINTLNCEARSARRVCVIELFGAESGFVAANAALASGHADLVLIPEIINSLTALECEHALQSWANHLKRAVNRDCGRPHGVVVVAEGVGRALKGRGVVLAGSAAGRDFIEAFAAFLGSELVDHAGDPIDVFVNRPLHHIRAGKANAHDQMYCERLGALAVDNALAGYTDFLISQWLTEYVLVPLRLVNGKRKGIPPEGIFWKQVCSSAGQPASLHSETATST